MLCLSKQKLSLVHKQEKNNMNKNALKKIQDELDALNDPNFALKKLLSEAKEEMAEIALGTKGEKGDTPVKGVDYFTADEISNIIDFIQGRVKPGEKGETGAPGKKGERGLTPTRGVDYWTKDDQAKLVADVLKKIKIPKGESAPKMEDIVKEVAKVINNNPKQDFVTVKQLTEFLQRGGFRGGGSSGGGGEGTVTSVATGAGLTGGPITDTGTISLNSKLAPLDTLGTAGQLIRVNAGATALEYFTAAAGGVDSIVGTADRITVNSADPANPIVDIASTYVGQTSITTLGTITTGVWSGTAIALNKITALTASRAVVSDGSGFLSAATTTATEIGYVNGVTSAIQTQLNAKAPSTSPTFATSITGSYLTAFEILITDGSKNIVSASVVTYPSLTELSYLKGVTSSVQTQLNAKGAGDIVGPASSTDNAIARFDSTTGKLIQDSAATIVDATGQFLSGNGTNSLPTYSFTSSTNSGLYHDSGSTGVSIAYAGVRKVLFQASLTTLTNSTAVGGANGSALIQGNANSATNPSYSFTGDTNTGLFSSAADTLDFATGGTSRMTLTTTGLTSAVPIITGAGSVGSPSFSVGTGGLYSGGAGILSFSNGTSGISWDGTMFYPNTTTTRNLGGASNIWNIGYITTIELGNASDTTFSRVSAGVAAIEGNNIVVNTSSPTLGTITTTGNIELGNASDTTLSRSAAGTLAVEGIRVKTTTPLVLSAASYTTDTGTSLNMDNLDMFIVTAQAGALLFNAPGGTLVQGRTLVIRIKDNGTARALTWNAVFRAMGTALPSTTVLGKTLYLGFFYNSTDTKWDLVASAQEV